MMLAGASVLIILITVALILTGYKKKIEYEDYTTQQEYFDKGYSDVVKPTDDKIPKYHSNKSVNSAIHKLVVENEYTEYTLLKEWRDITTNQDMYDVLFDDKYFYYIAVGDDGYALVIPGDYEMYLGHYYDKNEVE